LNGKIQGYPSVALGAFEVTPIEMAGAYTAFANEGLRMQSQRRSKDCRNCHGLEYWLSSPCDAQNRERYGHAVSVIGLCQRKSAALQGFKILDRQDKIRQCELELCAH
jgi:membrane carboxypeptidase/penicillin-binding protein PbpC